MNQVTSSFKLLNRTDYLLLLCYFFEILSESIVQANLLFYLTENYELSYATSVLILAGINGAEATVIILFGRVLDSYPQSGPLRVLSYANPVRIAAIVAILSIEVFWGVSENPAALPLIAIILIVFFGVGDGFTGLIFSLTIAEKTAKERDAKDQERGLDRVRAILLNLVYGLGNLALILSYLITFFWRWYFSKRIRIANDAILLTGVWIWIPSTLFAAWLSTLLPPRVTTTRKSIKSFTGVRPAPSPSSFGSVINELSSLPLHRYLILWLSTFGILFAFAQIAVTLPKYLVFRHDMVTDFSLMQIINPTIIVFLTFALPFVPWLHRFSSLSLLIVGTTIQGLSPLWEWLLGGTMTSMVLFLVQFTIGEAIGFPHLGNIQLEIIPAGFVGLYKSVGQILAIALNFGSNAMASSFISLLCADAVVCKRGSAPWIWACVSLVAMATPISLLIFYYGTRRTTKEEEEDKEDMSSL